MMSSYSNAQTELLNLFKTNLSDPDLARLKTLLAAFVQQTSGTSASTMVAEPPATHPYAAANDEQITLSIPKAWLDDARLAKLLNWLDMKRLSEHNAMTEAQALEMGNQAKSDWWEKNQGWVMAKIGKS